MASGFGFIDRLMTEQEVRNIMSEVLSKVRLDGKKVLILIPDATRSGPLPMMFRLFHELIGANVATLDFLIALGTHQPLNDEAVNRLVGISAEERATRYRAVRIFNHRWDLPETFATVGRISSGEIAEITGGLMSGEVQVRLNRMVFDYDQIMICGPTFPHEVVGFSGGNKYFFPGIGGDEVINFSHWLGAVITSYNVIGTKHTPVRRVIDRAASFIDRPKLCFSMVVKGEDLAGLFAGSPEEAYDAAAELSSKVHIVWIDKPLNRVLSVMPRMYDDIWTAAKGMYKMEPAIAEGGEVVIHAPHIDEISYTHGRLIDEVGYHVRDYFLKQWERFKHYPGGVLAHSTHLRGIGEYDADTATERPRIDVTLSSRIPEARCRKVNLGYLNPATVKPEDWRGRESEGIMLVPKAGEMLYRVKPQATGK